MVKISFIGAGSKGFAEKIITDLLSFPALRKNTIISLGSDEDAVLTSAPMTANRKAEARMHSAPAMGWFLLAGR